MCKIFDITLIGLGPAGIGFLDFLQEPIFRNVLCIDKGDFDYSFNCQLHKDTLCTHCESCSIISGLGGASRFSCGKISLYPAGSGLVSFFDSEDELVDLMSHKLNELSYKLELTKHQVSQEKRDSTKSFFSQNDVCYKYYDVYAFRKEEYCLFLSRVVKHAVNAGSQMMFNTEVVEINHENHSGKPLYSITTKCGEKVSRYLTKKVVLATGNINHSDRIMEFFSGKVNKMSYEIGVRVSVSTDKLLNVLASHGDLKLKYKDGRTYCVSKDGYIIAYSADDVLYLEGYSDMDSPSEATNFAILIKDNDLPTLERFKTVYKNVYGGIPIKQKYSDYLKRKKSISCLDEEYIPSQLGIISDLFSEKINASIVEFVDSVLINTLELKSEDITLYAPELKETWSVDLDKNFRMEDHLFVIGSATGRFRGILQSFCSGVRCAEIIQKEDSNVHI